MAPIFRITDGTTSINLIRTRGRAGFHLAEWQPATATYKQGGIWVDSPFSDGRKLVDAQWQHPIENIVLHLFPKWVADLATAVHFYEAVLASLAILVWHFYFVIFDPVVYPMDTAWLNGRETPGRAQEREE